MTPRYTPDMEVRTNDGCFEPIHAVCFDRRTEAEDPFLCRLQNEPVIPGIGVPTVVVYTMSREEDCIDLGDISQFRTRSKT
jgi:hypothetical protein